MSWALRCHDLWRSFGGAPQRVEVLRGVSLALQPAEVIAILGPSGSGKSTLLHLLAGLDRPDRGEIYWGELPVHAADQNRLARARLQRVGLVFQNHYLLGELTVLENVTLSGRLRGSVDERRGWELLAAVGLEGRAGFRPGKLSGGERQRVAVARALYAKPELVLADEPTGSLDFATGETVMDLMFELNREAGTTLVLVTHDRAIAGRCDRQLRIEAGRVELNVPSRSEGLEPQPA